MEALENEGEIEVEVEPDNWTAVRMWLRVQTQWRAGAAGVFGLDYTAVDVVLRRNRIDDADGQIFEALQVMEVAALRAMKG